MAIELAKNLKYLMKLDLIVGLSIDIEIKRLLSCVGNGFRQCVIKIGMI